MSELFTANALDGRRALVTGSSRGIGAAIATRLASLGAAVLLVADDENGLIETATAINESGGKAEFAVLDLMSRSDMKAFCSDLDDIDTLINNAAPAQRPVPLLESPDELWESMLALNLWAPLVMMRELGAKMVAAGGGCIVSTSSVSAHNPAGRIAPYAASKAALETLTKVASLELGPSGVRVNCVAPSMTRTARTEAMLADESFREQAEARVPLGRLAFPSDVANAVAWLVSDAAGFVTGQTLVVDGGSAVGTFSYTPPIVKP
jgi:NAD(P)-dependent dehydrogenase (short-subunit alcohol dehydrogenase family)